MNWDLIKRLIKSCIVIGIDEEIKEYFVHLRKSYQLKLPDAIVAATPMKSGLPLITADKRFFTIAELNLIQLYLE